MAFFDFLGFNNPNQEFKGLAQGYESRAKSFEDPNSEFYKKNQASFADFLNRQISRATPTLNTLLSLAKSSGLSGTSASAVANTQRIAGEARNREAVAGGVDQFTTNLLQTGLGYAGNLNNNATNLYGQYGAGQRQAQQNQVGFMNSIFGIGSTLGAGALAPKPQTNFNFSGFNPYGQPSGTPSFAPPYEIPTNNRNGVTT